MKKKDAYYFSHDSNARNDLKMVKLRRKQGLAGIGLFWCIIEMLREETGYSLPLSAIDDIAFELNAEPEAVNDVVRNYELFVITDTHFYSNRLLRSMQEYEASTEKRRRAGALGGQAKVKQRLSNAKATPEHTPSIKGNKSKVNKRKEKNNTPLPPLGDTAGSSTVDVNTSEEDSLHDWAADFKWFWNAYGRKVDRAKCERKFKKLSKEDRAAIREHVPKYVQATPEVQFRKHPATYLNNKCWQDEDLPGGHAEGIEFVRPKVYL